MKSTIEKIKEGDVVYASWKGEITGEERHQFRDDIQEFCEQIGSQKFIVDLRKQINTTDIADNYAFGKELRRKMKGYTIAAIYKPVGVNEDFLIATVKRGDVNIRVFTRLDTAKKWILNQ